MKIIGQQPKTQSSNDIERKKRVRSGDTRRVTRDAYGHNSKYSRKLVVVLHAPDLITIKPKGMRTDALAVTVNIGDIYKTLLVRKLLAASAKKARVKSEAAKAAKETRARRAQERRFSAKIKLENSKSAS